MRSAARASSTRKRSSRPSIGWSSTGSSGRRASTVLANTSRPSPTHPASNPRKEGTMTAVQSKSNEINIIRIYDAPVQAVWDAWTDPAQTAQWWGPRGFTLTTHSKDLRVGGAWVYTMHGPDGVDYPNTTKYLEVEPRAKLVYDHGGHADRPPMFRVTVLFADIKGRTK